MSPKYPVYVFDNDESSFREFAYPSDLLYCEKPDVLDGQYKGWDSAGRYFDLVWDESADTARINFPKGQSLQNSLNQFIKHVSKYESACEKHGISFSGHGNKGRDPGQICGTAKLHRVIKEIQRNHPNILNGDSE